MQNKKKDLIFIGICTYNRPQMLEVCLQSLIGQECPESAELMFCVADNNSNNEYNIKAVVDKTLSDHNYKYILVEKQGISFARNAIVECAIQYSADFIAFIDDDEYARNNWIVSLYKKIKSSGADVVQGKMVFNLPANTPEFLASLWKSTSLEEDAKLKSVATGNVIFCKKIIQEWKLRFNQKLALTGGEDLDFFLRSFNKGGRHIFTSKAIVYETVPEERATMKWQLQRRMQEGFVINYVLYLNRGRWYVLRKYFLKSLINIFKAPFYIIAGTLVSNETVRYKGQRKLWHAIGCFNCFFNIKIRNYKKITGN